MNKEGTLVGKGKGTKPVFSVDTCTKKIANKYDCISHITMTTKVDHQVAGLLHGLSNLNLLDCQDGDGNASEQSKNSPALAGMDEVLHELREVCFRW